MFDIATTINTDFLPISQIRDRILTENPTAKVSGAYIQKIKCPACGKNEAWAHADRPLAVICQRGNECYQITSIKEIYPEYFQDLHKQYPPTTTDPNATARAYLALRGLDITRFKFSQGNVYDVDSKISYQSVEIKIDADTIFHRLIDYSGKDKGRIFGSYKGKIWQPEILDYSKEIWIVEGIIDALSLIQAGKQAIAILSSSHCPTKFYDSIKSYNVQLIIAFDSDKAGKRAIDKHRSYFEVHGFNFKVAIPPDNKDWNDLLCGNALNPDNIQKTTNDSLFRGRLHCTRSAQEYFVIYYGYHRTNFLIFEYNNQIYKGWLKDENPTTARLSDCSMEIIYSIEDDSIDRQSKTKHIFKLFSHREGKNIVEFASDELANVGHFKSKLINYRQLYFGNNADLTNTIEFLFHRKSPKIRQCHSVGYDKKSNCFVFSRFLYNQTGKRFEINKDGYFDQHNLVPFKEKTIENLSEIDIKTFLNTLFRAYSYRGLIALGFWTASTFSHIIFNKFGFFPFLSMHGHSHCGKSDLTKMLNRVFFLDWEGLTMTKANTQKGELRKISQKASLVTPMLEGKKDKTRFDYDSVLPAYNRNALQIRAQSNQGNETHELSLEGTLAFVQNNEPFTSKPAKERVVSVHFSDKDLSDKTYEAWQQLMEYSPEQLAYVGHCILSNRNHFEQNIIKQIKKDTDLLRNTGIKITRIAENHAILLTMSELVCDFFGFNAHGIAEYTHSIAKTKLETARNENHIADYFFECLHSLTIPDNGSSQMIGYRVIDDQIIIHLPTIIQNMEIQNLGSWNKGELMNALNQHDSFIEKKASRHATGEKKECWIFKHTEN